MKNSEKETHKLEKSDSDLSESESNVENKNKLIIEYDKFSSSIISIHISIILLVFSLYFSYKQTLRNKGLKDEEIREQDCILGLAYIIFLIISIIKIINSYYTLSRDYELSKVDGIFKDNFIKMRLTEFFTTSILATIFCFSLYELLTEDYYFSFFIYLMSCSIYHFMEYIFVCNYHFENLSFDSFLMNQSKEFVFAIIFSYLEYFAEYFFFPNLKYNSILFYIGITCMLIGHFCRIGAMFTAKHNFTHLIAFRKKNDHNLVTNGIYSILRHPSYFGFFFWAVGAQIICVNPISLLAYYFVLSDFFKNRIEMEEHYLIMFFGQKYKDYMKRTGIYIPFYKKLTSDQKFY